MTIQELKDIRATRVYLEQLQERIEVIRSRCESMTAKIGTGGRGNGYKNQIETLVAIMADWEKELNERSIAYVINLQNIDKEISELKGDERNIMTARYIDGLSWNKIARVYNFSIQRCFQIHKSVLKKCQ